MPDSVEATLARIEQITSDTLQRVRELDKKVDDHLQRDHVALALADAQRDVKLEAIKAQVTTRTWIGGGGLAAVGTAIAALLTGRQSTP